MFAAHGTFSSESWTISSKEDLFRLKIVHVRRARIIFARKRRDFDEQGRGAVSRAFPASSDGHEAFAGGLGAARAPAAPYRGSRHDASGEIVAVSPAVDAPGRRLTAVLRHRPREDPRRPLRRQLGEAGEEPLQQLVLGSLGGLRLLETPPHRPQP